MLKLSNLSKIYSRHGKSVSAIDGISLQIDKGDFVAIIGPSGSGKSSLLLMMGGMLSPSSGEICLEDQSIFDLSSRQRAALRQEKIGFLFQTFNLVPYLSALQNVLLPMLFGGLDKGSRRNRALTLLDEMGLADRVDHKPSELSIGQQQRVAFARMLANDPPLILADEPTGSLDPEMSHQMIAFLKELNEKGKTIVLVTHDLNVARQANRVIEISKGGAIVTIQEGATLEIALS